MKGPGGIRLIAAALAVLATATVGVVRLTARGPAPDDGAAAPASLSEPSPAAALERSAGAVPVPAEGAAGVLERKRGACARWGEAVPGVSSVEATLCFGVAAVVRDGVAVDLTASDGDVVVWLERVSCAAGEPSCRSTFDVAAAPATSVSVDSGLERALIDATIAGRCRVAVKIVGMGAPPAERAEVFASSTKAGATIRVAAADGSPSVRAAQPSGEAAVCGERFDETSARAASIFEAPAAAVEARVTTRR